MRKTRHVQWGQSGRMMERLQWGQLGRMMERLQWGQSGRRRDDGARDCSGGSDAQLRREMFCTCCFCSFAGSAPLAAACDALISSGTRGSTAGASGTTDTVMAEREGSSLVSFAVTSALHAAAAAAHDLSSCQIDLRRPLTSNAARSCGGKRGEKTHQPAVPFCCAACIAGGCW